MTEQIESFDELVNRRQYFRIVDRVSIELSKLEANQQLVDKFSLNPEFGLMSEFQLLDVESKHLLRALSDKDKNLGQFLKLMNKKLDSLARVIALNHQAIPPESMFEVNLSEGGISYIQKREFARNDRLAIKLVLFPAYSGLLLEGKVLCCHKTDDGFNLHIEFLDIPEVHQQLIARHIMRLQSQQKNQQTTIEQPE